MCLKQKVSVEWTVPTTDYLVHTVWWNMVSFGVALSLRFGRLIAENVVNTGKYETSRFVKRCVAFKAVAHAFQLLVRNAFMTLQI